MQAYTRDSAGKGQICTYKTMSAASNIVAFVMRCYFYFLITIIENAKLFKAALIILYVPLFSRAVTRASLYISPNFTASVLLSLLCDRFKTFLGTIGVMYNGEI